MSRTVVNMDMGWKFLLGDVITNSANKHSASYQAAKSGAISGPGGKKWLDRDWRIVNLPHDYFAESDISENNLMSHGYRTRNNAWYRKVFVLDPSLADKEIYICFEGTAVNADFYFNGSLVTHSFSASTETMFNITDRIYFDGTPNVLAVHIDGFSTEGWWYEGAGIYRHVKLYAKDKLHIAHNGIYGKPVLKKGCKNSWTVEVETTLENSNYYDAQAKVRATILDGENVIAQGISSVCNVEKISKNTNVIKLNVSKPKRWDVDDPKLYTLRVEVLDGDTVTDEDSVRIGFRTFSIDADHGFFLNGRKLIIKGTSNHADHAGVGVAVPDSVQYYRIKRIKEMGCNAYRCAHNLHAKEVLDACDELGIIVMDENRRFESNDTVLGYVDNMIRRDRNHPSVIFWSLFNEEFLQNTEIGARIYKHMRSVVEKLDNTRLMTGAINGTMEGAGLEMDVVGINYAIQNIDEMHRQYPDKPIIGSENNSAVSTRGCYKTDTENTHVLSNYDEEKVPWGQTIRETWDFVRKHEYYAGIFIWTGFDYRGEPTPFTWPSVSSQFGAMDTCGFPKDSFYFNKACFTDKPMVHLLPHWNHEKGEHVRVMAVSNCEEVELFLNGRSLGRKHSDICTDTPEWNVEFIPGRISAKAYRNGKCVAKAENRTAGKPYAIKAMPYSTDIKDDGQDTAIVNFAVVDKHGVIVPNADNLLHFEVIGNGYIKGVGNGDPNSHESDVLPKRHTYCGLCQALVTSNIGAKNISLRAYADGLEDAIVTFNTLKAPQSIYPQNAEVSSLDGFTMSKVTEEKQNATIEIADNDMNSFIPIVITDMHQKDFCHGWRIYRVLPEIYESKKYRLRFSYARFDYAEFYVNGQLLDTVDKKTNGEYVTPYFPAEKGESPDIRILMYAENESPVGAGIAGSVDIEYGDIL